MTQQEQDAKKLNELATLGALIRQLDKLDPVVSMGIGRAQYAARGIEAVARLVMEHREKREPKR